MAWCLPSIGRVYGKNGRDSSPRPRRRADRFLPAGFAIWSITFSRLKDTGSNRGGNSRKLRAGGYAEGKDLGRTRVSPGVSSVTVFRAIAGVAVVSPALIVTIPRLRWGWIIAGSTGAMVSCLPGPRPHQHLGHIRLGLEDKGVLPLGIAARRRNELPGAYSRTPAALPRRGVRNPHREWVVTLDRRKIAKCDNQRIEQGAKGFAATCSNASQYTALAAGSCHETTEARW